MFPKKIKLKMMDKNRKFLEKNQKFLKRFKILDKNQTQFQKN